MIIFSLLDFRAFTGAFIVFFIVVFSRCIFIRNSLAFFHNWFSRVFIVDFPVFSSFFSSLIFVRRSRNVLSLIWEFDLRTFSSSIFKPFHSWFLCFHRCILSLIFERLTVDCGPFIVSFYHLFSRVLFVHSRAFPSLFLDDPWSFPSLCCISVLSLIFARFIADFRAFYRFILSLIFMRSHRWFFVSFHRFNYWTIFSSIWDAFSLCLRILIVELRACLMRFCDYFANFNDWLNRVLILGFREFPVAFIVDFCALSSRFSYVFFRSHFSVFHGWFSRVLIVEFGFFDPFTKFSSLFCVRFHACVLSLRCALFHRRISSFLIVGFVYFHRCVLSLIFAHRTVDFRAFYRIGLPFICTSLFRSFWSLSIAFNIHFFCVFHRCVLSLVFARFIVDLRAFCRFVLSLIFMRFHRWFSDDFIFKIDLFSFSSIYF